MKGSQKTKKQAVSACIRCFYCRGKAQKEGFVMCGGVLPETHTETPEFYGLWSNCSIRQEMVAILQREASTARLFRVA